MSIEQDTTSSKNQPASAASVEVPSNIQKQSLGQLLRGDLGFIPVLATFVAIVIYFQITTNGLFLLPVNISNLLQQIATTGIDALGVTLVLLLGEIDLSVASVGTFGAVVMGVLINYHGFSAWEAILCGILAGAPDILGVGLPTVVLVLYALGLVFDQVARRRAGLRTKPLLRLIAQIVIAAVAVEGIVFVLENTPSTGGKFLGVPNSTAILFGLILIMWLVLTKTTFGRHIYAVGGNAEASRRAGINVTGIRIAVFTLCSTLAAIGGIVAASYANAVATQINPTLLLDSIAAAVIGGVSLFGGVGSVWSIVLGALIIGSLENGLDLKSQTTDVKQMVEGAVLLIAVTVDAVVRRLQARSGR